MSGRYVGSDDSYVHANKLMVSTDVSGLIKSVNVHEGQQVKEGEVLFTLDPKPFQIALDNAKAALAQTVQDVESTRATYRAAVAQIAAQQAQVNVNQQTYDRYLALAKQNAIAAMQVDTQRGRGSERPGDAGLAAAEGRHPAGQAERQSQPAGRTDAGLSEGQGGGGRGSAPARPCHGARAVRRHGGRSGFAAARHAGDLGHVGLHHHQRGGPDRQRHLDRSPT